MLRVNWLNKSIIMLTERASNEGMTPTLWSDGYLS